MYVAYSILARLAALPKARAINRYATYRIEGIGAMQTIGSLRRAMKPLLLGMATVAVVAGASVYGIYYWRTARFLESTDDAYVQADYTAVAPKVAGYIQAVQVGDNERVEAGQVLARIDDRDLVTARDQAKADVASAAAAVTTLDAQIQLQHTLIDQAKAAVEADDAVLQFARQDNARYSTLSTKGFGSLQQAQQAGATLRESEATLQRDQAALQAARKQTAVLDGQRAGAAATLQHDQAVLRQAELNLGYATITAPIDGTIGARSVRVGQYVQAGTQLMAVVPLHAVYIVGNFKETQLTHVRQGEPVSIRVDTFPGVTLEGRVDSLAPASGQEFALLPPDNATGNFTKVVQRVPVRIVLDDSDRLAGLLRPGMSVEPTIDTKATQLAEAAHATRLADADTPAASTP
jgi:membrane fusion protein (multidrug efflux system)